MDRRVFLNAALLGVLVAPSTIEAQEVRRLPRVGHLFLQPWFATGHLREAFRQGLNELGYVEGQNITIEFRNADGTVERLRDLATELVRLPVDVIVAAPDASVQAAKLATRAIPIIMALSEDLSFAKTPSTGQVADLSA